MLILKIKIFLNALFWHVWFGFPKANQDQIYMRYNICESCDQFDTKRSECMVCGCSIGTKKKFMNKLAWADQKCPLDKWKSLV